MDDLEDLLARATRGLWWFDNNDGYGPAAVHAAHKTNPHAYEVVAQAVGDSAEAEANARLIAMAPNLAAALIEAEKALAPFDEMAGEMFARNWNDDGVAISFITQNGPLRLTFKEFRAVRAAMTEIKKLRGE